MSEEELKNLTVKEICNYIAVMNRLVNEGIIKFNKEKAYTEICVDEATIYLEKQNVQLQQENARLKQLLENAQNISVADHRYASEKEDEVIELKSVLKEIREYINKQLASCDNESNLSYEICSLTVSKYKKLLEIIDKGIGE